MHLHPHKEMRKGHIALITVLRGNICNLNIVFKGENLIFIGMELEIFIQDKRQERWSQQPSSAMQRILIWGKGEADEGQSAERKPHSSAYRAPSSKYSKDDLFSTKSGRMLPSLTPMVLMQDLATVEGTQTSFRTPFLPLGTKRCGVHHKAT